MEQHYFLITPLMSLLQGANIQWLGMGIFQWRLLPAMAGALTCGLTFAVGRRCVSARAAVLGVLLLLGWQWARAGATLMALTGIPLMDVARIVRHDILVAPLGLAAWWAFIRQRQTGRLRYAVLSGLLAGLAGLAHVYGLFWIAAFGVIVLVERWWDPRRPALRPVLLAAASALLVWVPVLIFVLSYGRDFSAQAIQSRSRFELFSPAFYLSNVLGEVHRYNLGWREPAAWLSPGAWALVLGVPAAWLALARRAWPGRDRRALWVLAPALAFPVLFALLIEPKTFNYLVAVAPVFCLLLAGGVTDLLAAAPRAGRILVGAGLGLVLVQGGLSLARAQVLAAQTPRPAETYAALRNLIPSGARVMGHQQYWPGLYDREFRSFGLPFFLAGADMTLMPVSFAAALEQVAPEYVLLDTVMRSVFADGASAQAADNSAQFWRFMDAHHARRLVTLNGGAEGPLEVYQLEW
jgi:4-amino-4-deoxy-L-arabinose transferase-like glycosyltransferase